MRIVCPKCELKGQVNAAPVGAKTRIACVRCAATFDAVFIDGQVQILLPQDNAVKAIVESAGNDLLTAGPDSEPTVEIPHEIRLNASLPIESSPDLENNLLSSSPDLILEKTVETSSATLEGTSLELARQSEETLPQETSGGSEPSIAVAASLKYDGAAKVRRPPSDVYGLGVRLMRVSPMWLLLAGLSFISFIVLCNWIVKPVEPTGEAASMIAANNRATNQSTNHASVSNPPAQSPINGRHDQPVSESGVASIAAEAKEISVPHTAPSAEMVEEKSAVEAQQAIPASTPNPSDEAKKGKITIQVGSYNEAAQAEERVASLKSAGFEARRVAIEIPQRGTWYRVQSGRFVRRDEAERYGKQLRDKGLVSSFITTDVQE